MSTPLIEPVELAASLEEPELRVCDCRFNLMQPQWGHDAYISGHIPGAVYVHLEHDLSGPPVTDRGRHPMPDTQAMTALFSRLGIDQHTRVVAYDQRDGATASRLWWMLRYMGHASVQVLNGGFEAWLREGYAVEEVSRAVAAADFHGTPERERLVTLDEVAALTRLFDARDRRRYRGEVEPIDPVAGHIPGAHNLPYAELLDEHGRLLEVDALRALFTDAFDGCDPASVTYSCGSGVTGCHLALAASVAGFDRGRLYGGSFSEWCRAPGCDVVTGE